MKYLIAMCFVLLMISLIPFYYRDYEFSNLEDMENSSITVDCTQTHHGYGSGVIFKNKVSSFVWTDAHVIKEERLENGKYTDVLVKELIKKDGRKVGENSRLAKIIRVSDNEDIALLYVYERNYGAKSVKFSNKVPNTGDKIWHIGSFQGPVGMQSVSDGVIANTGRLRGSFRHNDFDPDAIIYDQVSAIAHPGSSGGGVFSKSNGDCLGLVSHFLFVSPASSYRSSGSFCMVPSRRIINYAHKSNCVWAVNKDFAAPSIEDVEVITN